MSGMNQETPADQGLKTQAHGTNGPETTSNKTKRRHVNGLDKSSESSILESDNDKPIQQTVPAVSVNPECDVSLHSPVGVGSSENSTSQGIYGTLLGGSRTAQYEELFGGSMACPTCRGSGRIPRDTADEMVALIPISDKRLRPRRTCLYVCIAVGICTLVGGLLMYFLLPRNIKLESGLKTLHPFERHVNKTEQIVFLRVRDEYNITNNNYFPVYVTKMHLATSFDQKSVGVSANTTRMMVPLRATASYSIDVNITFNGSEGYIAYYCSTGIPGSHSILMPFVATMSSTYFGHSEETTLQTYKHVLCGPQHKKMA